MLILLLLNFALAASKSFNSSGNSYYFKTNGNNEFRIYNRVHFLNHNITDLDYNYNRPRRVENIQVLKADERPKVVPQKFFLDEEWDYVHKDLNKTDLPRYIHKLYESRAQHPLNRDTVRVLFNDNRNQNSSIFKFNLNSLKDDENVTGADLYFYWPLENTSSIFKTSVVLRLYQIEKSPNQDLNESNLIENPDLHKLFNVIYISKATKGWQIFWTYVHASYRLAIRWGATDFSVQVVSNSRLIMGISETAFKIKKPIDNWRHKEEENMGLLLTISSFDENKLISVYNDSNKGIFSTFAVLNVHKNSSVYVDNTTHSESNETLTALRHCHKRNWFVSFQKLHWNQVVIAPSDGFVAYDCTGRCNSPETEQGNHVKLVNVFGTRHSCCVPSEYLPLPIMFFDKFENVALKSYDQMVVSKCECR